MAIRNRLSFRRAPFFLRLILILFLMGSFSQRVQAAVNADCSPGGDSGTVLCNAARTNPCIQEVCATNSTVNSCISAGYDVEALGCSCSDCGNGICNDDLGENSTNCPEDCTPTLNGVDNVDVCDVVGCVSLTFGGGAFDLCCPRICQGTDPSDLSSFDSDCACINFEPCGDSVVQSPETCDGSPGCRARGSVDQCTSCGDLIVQPESETCDGSNLANETLPFLTSEACRGDCTYCGDGIIDVADGEECDDGNAVDTDACSSTCHFISVEGSGCSIQIAASSGFLPTSLPWFAMAVLPGGVFGVLNWVKRRKK